jgi:hypothetical protein
VLVSFRGHDFVSTTFLHFSASLAGGGIVETERVGSVPASRITAWQAALAETPLALATKSTTDPDSPVPKSFHRLPSA